MSDDGKAALNVADGAVATERAGSSQGSNAAVGVFDGDDGVCRDADEDIAGGEGSSAIEGMVQFDPVEDASENQPSVSAMLDPAVLSMGGNGLQEGANRLLPPLNVDPLQAEDVLLSWASPVSARQPSHAALPAEAVMQTVRHTPCLPVGGWMNCRQASRPQ